MLIIIVISVDGFVKCCVLNAIHHVTILGIHELTPPLCEPLGVAAPGGFFLWELLSTSSLHLLLYTHCVYLSSIIFKIFHFFAKKITEAFLPRFLFILR